MNIQTINTPEKLHQDIVKFLESDYSQEDLVETYNNVRKCAIRFRGIYPTLPALPACKNNPLDGLQDVMEWCNKASKVVDDIVSNLERQTIIAVISQLKKLRDFPSRVLSLVSSKLREQAQKEARAKVEKDYKNLNDKVSRLKPEKMLLIDQAKVVGELQLEGQGILRREAEEIVQIYLSKDPTFKERLSKLNSEINEMLETLDKLIGSSTSTGKLLDIYCKLKDIPLQQQFDDVGYAYCPIDDLTDVICNGCDRLYVSVDNVIKTFEEIQTKVEQKTDEAPLQVDVVSLPKDIEDRSTKKKTSVFNKDFFNNFIKATIKHLPYVGPYLFDVIYGVDGVKAQKKEGTDLENKKLTKKEHDHHYIKAGRDIVAGGDIIVGNAVLKNSSVKSATKDKRDINKWYQSRTIQAALIGAGVLIFVSIVGWLIALYVDKSDRSEAGTKSSIEPKTSEIYSPAIAISGPNNILTIDHNSKQVQAKPLPLVKKDSTLIEPEETDVNQHKTVYEAGVAILEIFKADSIETIPKLPVIRTYWERDLAYSGWFLLPDRFSEIGMGSSYVARFSFYYEAKESGYYGFSLLHDSDNTCKLTIGGIDVTKANRESAVQGVCNLKKGFHRVEFWLVSKVPYCHPWDIPHKKTADFQVKFLAAGGLDTVPLTKDMMLLKKE